MYLGNPVKSLAADVAYRGTRRRGGQARGGEPLRAHVRARYRGKRDGRGRISLTPAFPAGGERPKLQSGAAAALIREGNREERGAGHACSGTRSHTSGECLGPAARKSLEEAENWGKTHTRNRHARRRAHMRAEGHEYAGRSAFPRLVITALREHPAGCSCVVEGKRNDGSTEAKKEVPRSVREEERVSSA